MLNWKKKIIGTALALGLGIVSLAAQAAVTLKISSPTNNDITLKWAQGFKQKVEQRSKGEITVEIYPANQLGQIPATVEGVMFGTIEVTAAASGFFVKLDPRFEVFDVLGLFDSHESAQRVLSDPEILDRIATYGNDKGVTTIAAYSPGPLGLVAIDGVRKVADISGKKLRVAGPSLLHIAPYQHMGAAPLSMPLGEVLSAMQTRVVDGLLAGIPAYTIFKYYDVAKPMTILPKSYAVVTAVASKAFLDRLDPQLAKVVKESARDALGGANQWSLNDVDQVFEIWKQNGGEIIEFSPEEEKRYLDAVEAVMPEVLKANPLLKDEIDAFQQARQRLGS